MPLEGRLNTDLFSKDVELDLLPVGIFIFSVLLSLPWGPEGGAITVWHLVFYRIITSWEF